MFSTFFNRACSRANNRISNKALPSQLTRSTGFTLIEIIIGIVVLSIALSIVSTLIAPAEEKSADNILQIKASELAQSLMNDIMSRAFDDNSDMAGGFIRCDEIVDTITIACTDEVDFGSEEGADRNLFDDVDDFNGYTEKKNSTNDGIDSGYNQFNIEVSVTYAGDDLGLTANRLAKRITIKVTTPLGTGIEFTSHKTNF